MSSYHFQPSNLALEEPSASVKAFRKTSSSQSPKNLRNSGTSKNIFSSPQTNNTYAQSDFNSLSVKNGVSEFASPNAHYPTSTTPPPGSGNNNLTVDFLLQKVDDLLKQSQTPVKPQFNQQARQEATSYSQANPFGQNSGTSSLRQSAVIEGKPRKNDIFVKKSFEAPRDSQTLMTSPAKDLQTQKPIEKQNELFPIRESLRNSTLSIGAAKSPVRDVDIKNDMGDIRSRLNNLESQLNNVGSSNYNNSTYNDPFVTPRSQSIPPLRSEPLYTTPIQSTSHYESIKKSPYISEDYLIYSVEKPKSSQPAYVETNPKKDAEVSEQICQTIDHLIQTHLMRDRSPSKSSLMTQRSYYTSPTRQPYDPAATNSLYKSSILPRESSEPVHKSSQPSTYSYQPSYSAAEPVYKSTTYNYESSYTATEPVHKSAAPLPASSSYQSTYEPYSVYESKYNYEPSASKYEPLDSKYEPTTSKYEPYRPYESKSTYDPLPAYESRYDPLPSYDHAPSSYDRDLKSSSLSSRYNQKPLGGDYDGSVSARTRPHYVRPLHRNSPPRYGDSQSNWSASASGKYTSPHSNDYFNKNQDSGLSTPKRENPYSHQDTSSTDRKMKKLTLKSKVSEEKDYERMDLPRQTSSYGKKGLDRQSYKSSELLPDWSDDERQARAKNRQNFKSSELLSDNERESDDISLRATKKGTFASQPTQNNSQTQKKVRAAPTQAPEKAASKKNNFNNYKAGELEDDDDRKAGGMYDDATPHAAEPVGELVDDSEGEEWEEREEREEREVDLAKEREQERERVREKAKEYEREKERERVKELEKQRMRQSQKVTRNVPDDGKAWNMVHKLPSSVFEDADNSFDFNVKEPQQRAETESDRRHVVRASNTVKPKPANQSRKDSGKAMIWAMDEPVTKSQRQSLTNLSDSMRRTEKKPVISHVFEKSGRHGY